MERGKPWHPFRHPGLCGLRGTTTVLTVLTTVVVMLVFFLTTELIEEAIKHSSSRYDDTDMNVTTASNETLPRRIKRASLTLITPTRDQGEEVVTLMEGSNVRFECNPYLTNCPYCRDPGYGGSSAEYAAVYFCKDPCGWGDVKAYNFPREYGQDQRFKVTKRDIYGSNKYGMSVVIVSVKNTDAGKYYCGIDRSGKDWYETLNIVVEQPALKPVRPIFEPTIEPASKDEMAWMGNEGAGRGTANVGVRRAMAKCQGNKACTLALLQKKELDINTSCWLCLQMSHAWKVVPLTVATLKETECLIPQQMTELLRAAADVERGRIPRKRAGAACTGTRQHGKPEIMIPPLRVMHMQGDVCVCRERPNTRLKVGWSDCRIRIDMKSNRTGENCTATIDGMVTNFTCPFSKPNDTSPAAVWVCGDRAYHCLPEKLWAGCCYPALMNVGTSVYLPGADNMPVGKTKRSVDIHAGDMPTKYNGYTLSSPWTTPGAAVGWSIFLGAGTAVTINKINGLAWSVLAIANSTETALTMINDEMKQIRDAVIQNRLVLDMLTAEKGGVCKMLGTSCCFYIPDYSENVSNVIVHMREAVKVPEYADDSWVNWLRNLGSNWGLWLCGTIMPVFAVGLLIIVCLPCFFKWVSKSVNRVMRSNVELKMFKTTTYLEKECDAISFDSSDTYTDMHPMH